MRVEGLTVALRPRSAWEATDLGIALVRRHAATIWAAWVLTTLPVLVLLCIACALLDVVWLVGLLLWWWKPVFDRVPLYILSRAVFGAAPGVAETVRAQLNWGWRAMFAWLTWRRLHPARSLLLPVDLLEGLSGSRRGDRVRVLQRSSSGTSFMTMLVAVNMEAMLTLSIIALVLMFVPVEFLTVASKAMWEDLFVDPPLWARLAQQLIYWLAMSVIEPFYVGAGFGLYLNRRTQLEAWDVELAFRRLAARLGGGAAAVLLTAGLGLFALAAQPVAAASLPLPASAIAAASLVADDAKEAVVAEDKDKPAAAASSSTDKVSGQAAETVAEDTAGAPADSLQRVFAGQHYDGDAKFREAVTQAYRDPDLSPKTTVHVWERIVPAKPGDTTLPNARFAGTWLESVARVFAFLAENILWVLAAFLIVILVRYHRVWLSWVSDRFDAPPPPDPLQIHDIAVPDALPDDLPGAVRTLWRQGQQRAALALFYRAAVKRLDQNLGAPLPPGATEAECLRRARRLGEHTYGQLFQRIVRCWQAAAYARRLPPATELETLLTDWSAPQGEAA